MGSQGHCNQVVGHYTLNLCCILCTKKTEHIRWINGLLQEWAIKDMIFGTKRK